MNLTSTVDKRVKGFIQQRFFYNKYMQGLVWRMYYAPDKRSPQIAISPGAEKYLAELRENGISAIPGFASVADHIERTYFSVMDGRKQSADRPLEVVKLGAREEASGSVSCRVSFKDPDLAPLLFDSDVCGIIYNYYQRQPFYRQQPWVIKNALTAEMDFEEFTKHEVSAKFHVDCYRQIVLMLLVNDLTVEDTHLQFAIGSHKFTRHSWDRFKYADEEVLERYPIFDAVGPKGTLMIMDVGSGLHRGLHKKSTVRKTLQAVVTTGHYYNLDEPKMTTSDWPALARYPGHVRHMMDRLV
jgi:hypothetical protein